MLSATQLRFVGNQSCHTNLLPFIDEITRRLDRGDRVEVCYLDFRKAFDSVDHRLLIRKISVFIVIPIITQWIEAILMRRLFRVVVNGDRSSPALLKSGVPQGSVLGPLLLLIYVNDLTVKLHSPCNMSADELKLVGNPSKNQPPEDLNRLYQWTLDWELTLNVDKFFL